jgi:hypothetical protein
MPAHPEINPAAAAAATGAICFLAFISSASCFVSRVNRHREFGADGMGLLFNVLYCDWAR